MKPFSLAAAAMLAACLPTALRADDQIYNFAGNVTARGTITSMTPAEVVVSTSAGDRRFPANEIRNIVFEEDTGEARTVKTRVFSGQIEQALQDVNALNLAEFRRPEVRADLEFYKAYCLAQLALQGNGDKVAAARALVGFTNTYPASYHLIEAWELTGDLSQAMGRFDVSAQYYAKLATAPWPDVQMKGLVLEASALVAQEKFGEAASKYDAVLAKPNDDPASSRQKLFAQLGKAYCIGQAGQAEQGITMAEAVIKDNDPQDQELFARAYNTLGVCHLKAGRKKEALRAFLHTDLMFTSSPDAHAESLYYLAGLWEDLEHSERALQAKSLLKSRYASTIWANK